MNDSKTGAIRPHLGSFAIAFAIIFAAGVYGFVASPAFAVFFMCFVGFLLFCGLGLLMLSAADDMGWFGGIGAGLFFLVAIAALVGGIQDAREQIMHPAKVAPAQ